MNTLNEILLGFCAARVMFYCFMFYCLCCFYVCVLIFCHLYYCIDVRLSDQNKDYLLTYLLLSWKNDYERKCTVTTLLYISVTNICLFASYISVSRYIVVGVQCRCIAVQYFAIWHFKLAAYYRVSGLWSYDLTALYKSVYYYYYYYYYYYSTRNRNWCLIWIDER